jgi:hypothetical protein
VAVNLLHAPAQQLARDGAEDEEAKGHISKHGAVAGGQHAVAASKNVNEANNEAHVVEHAVGVAGVDPAWVAGGAGVGGGRERGGLRGWGGELTRR